MMLSYSGRVKHPIAANAPEEVAAVSNTRLIRGRFVLRYGRYRERHRESKTSRC